MLSDAVRLGCLGVDFHQLSLLLDCAGRGGSLLLITASKRKEERRRHIQTHHLGQTIALYWITNYINLIVHAFEC